MIVMVATQCTQPSKIVKGPLARKARPFFEINAILSQ